MTGIKISKVLKGKLPENQREDVEERLWDQSGGKCFLCGEPLNRAKDEILADHDQAEIEGGGTTIENLNLVHKACNSAKRNNPTINVKPYLHLQAFIRKNEGSVRYGECVAHFGIEPKASVVTFIGSEGVKVELPDGTITESPVYSMVNADGRFRYCFVQVPRNALFNDDECQPRNIKLAQVWAIYVDLQKNPLHEPPGCRLIQEGKKWRIAMFDGQHKTVASWMSGQQNIVVKLYLDISLHQTIRLVNSVQAKIKKLPLSPFEIAAKLADEWRGQFEEYEAEVGSERVSEKGFIDWLNPNDRRRGKQAFEEARIQRILDREEFALLRFIKRGGVTSPDGLIPEAAFKSKLLKELVSQKPLAVEGAEGELLRTREAENITKVLNHFATRVFEPNGEGVPLDEAQLETRRRFSYQASLRFVGEMLPKVIGNICHKEADTSLMEASFTEEQWSKVAQAIDTLVDHPVWHKDFKIGEKAKAVEEALLKNQGAKEALVAVGLSFGYIVGGEELSGNWYK
ncbi:HNH endonuclease [Luteimonas dalianensis]|uniref:HNH endonuclease n=1 Tax=Luteimonas dalianensis TaxID=1148196 RepID=UPI003BF1B66A